VTDKLKSLLAELPNHPSPPGWQDRVRAAIAAGAPVSAIRPPPSRRPLWIAGTSVALAAAAVALFLGRCQPGSASRSAPDRPVIAMHVQAHDGGSRGATARVGDTVVITAERADELRVYRDGKPIARCPGEAGCRRGPDGLQFTLAVMARGVLSAIAFQPALPRDLAAQSSLDTDIGLAARVHSEMAQSAPIDVL
jgi:hypothetical protein